MKDKEWRKECGISAGVDWTKFRGEVKVGCAFAICSRQEGQARLDCAVKTTQRWHHTADARINAQETN